MILSRAVDIILNLLKPGRQMRTAIYTAEEIQDLFEKRQIISNYSDNYNCPDNMFIIIDKNGKALYSSHCKESTCVYARMTMHAKLKHWRIGITRNSVDLQRMLAVSNLLHDVERQLNMSFHEIGCFSISQQKHKVGWSFKLDPMWYYAPPMLSYLLDIIRRRFNSNSFNTDALKQEMMFTLLEKKRAHVLFGRDKKKNWQIDRKSKNLPGGFESSYGMNRFIAEVCGGGEGRVNLKNRYPKNKIFDE